MTTNPRPLRAALYLRLSVAGDEESTSIARQERDLRTLAEREGWTINERHVFTDDGYSGRQARDRADAAVAALRSGEVDVLAVWKFDRFSRQGIRGLVPLLDALETRPRALFVSIQDGLRSGTPAWDIVAPILATFARIESDNTATRVRSAIIANRESGRWTGGPSPIGYRTAPNPSGPGRILEPAPDEVPYLIEAARRIVEGESLYAVAAYMNSTPFRPRRARDWSLQAIRQALTGTAIVGRLTARGEVLRDADGLPRQVFDAALPLDLWHAVRAEFAARTEVRPAGTRARTSRSRLLSGIAVCATCGSPLYVRRSQGGAPVYRCPARSNGRTCATSACITATLLEEHVEAEFLAAAGRLPVLRPVEVEPSAVALADAEEALRDIVGRLIDPALSGDEVARLVEVRGTLSERVTALRSEADAPGAVTFEDSGETYADVWARTTDDATRREHLAHALAYVAVGKGVPGRKGKVDPSRIEVRWRDEVDQAVPVDYAAA